MLEIRNLKKSFNGRAALKDVSFTVERGQIYGLLGHNGAGKSTTLGIILGMVAAGSGEVLIDGVSVQQQRSKALRKVGAIFEAPSFYDYLSGWNNLKILVGYSGKFDEKLALYFLNDYLVKDDQIIIVDCILSEPNRFELIRESNPRENPWFTFRRWLA